MLLAHLSFERGNVLVVVIGKENLVRMQEGDPITLESIQRGGFLPALSPNTSLLIAYDDDPDKLSSLSPLDLLEYLEKNRKWIPGKDGIVGGVRIDS